MAPARPVAISATNAFDRPLESIRRRLDVATAVIRLLDGDALDLHGCSGAVVPELARETAFCDEALTLGRPFVLPDAALDDRFAQDPLVAAGPRIRFYAGIPLFAGTGRIVGVLSLFDTRPRSAAAAQQLAELAEELTAPAAPQNDKRTIARLRAEIETQATVIREQATILALSRKIFERASATAKIGVWQCDLDGAKLNWTDAVYDIFDLPRGSAISREQTLPLYTEESRKRVQELRAKAIRESGGFSTDAEIITAKGNRRWIRITAMVESEHGVAVRIFGMKQDITEEKLLSDRTRYLAEFDVMTGLANRGQFQARLTDQASIGALLLIDLDGFKQVNDTHGHALGDECLKEVAQRLGRVCGAAELVARIGGDEFAVMLGPQADQDAIEALAGEIVAIVGHPIARGEQFLKLGASVGIARGAGVPATDLFKQADAALYAAKAGGRNTFRVFGATD